MKKHYFSLLFSLLLTSSVFAQFQCGTDRFQKAIFETVDTIRDVQYGSNEDWQGNSTDLFIDIYHAPNDTSVARPVIMLAHGGFFLQGSKEAEDMQRFCHEFARMGYVAISLGYRLGASFPPDSIGLSEAVLRGVQDGAAAIRYLKRDVVENGNTYGVDTTMIVVGGSSAGGFLGLHLAFMNDDSKIPTFIDTTRAGLSGGVIGKSGNPGYSNKVNAVLSFAGAFADTALITDAIPVFSAHGTNDIVVPFGSGPVRFNILQIIHVDGSASIHHKLERDGTPNCFKPFVNTGHVAHNDAFNPQEKFDTTLAYASQFVYELLCENAQFTCLPEFESTDPEDPVGMVSLQADKPYTLLGNTENTIRLISLRKELSMHIFDAQGRFIEQVNFRGEYNAELPASGIHFLRIQETETGKTWVEKVIKP